MSPMTQEHELPLEPASSIQEPQASEEGVFVESGTLGGGREVGYRSFEDAGSSRDMRIGPQEEDSVQLGFFERQLQAYQEHTRRRCLA